MTKITEGLYEEVINKKLNEELENSIENYDVDKEKIDNEEASRILADYLTDVIKTGLDNKSQRASCTVKHGVMSGINYVSVKHSKVVSILSSAAGVTPHASAMRWNKDEKKKVEMDFPQVFAVYNKTMGGVDLHDQDCSDSNVKVKSDNWNC